jgi:hypothetical protein
MSSVTDTAERAVHHAAAHTRSSLIDLGAQALRLVNDIRAAEVRGVDSVLGSLGLQRRESALRPVVWFVAGAAVAGAVVFILAPTQGKKIRDGILSALDTRKRPTTNGTGPSAEEDHTAAPAAHN